MLCPRLASANGFAGLNSKIRVLRRPDVPWDAVQSGARFAAPTGMTFDAYGDDKFKVQFSGSLLDGQRTLNVCARRRMVRRRRVSSFVSGFRASGPVHQNES